MKRFSGKLHYLLKYFFIALPVFELVFFLITNVNSRASMISFITSDNTIFKSIGSSSYGLDLASVIENVTGVNSALSIYFTGVLLWIVYVYIFDILLDVLIFIPKVMHSIVEKVSGSDD